MFSTPDQPERPGPTYAQIALWLVVLVLSASLYGLKFNTFQVGVFGDDSSYVILARSLVHADVYGFTNLPGEPGISKYPFAYPLFLAVWEWLAPGQIELLPTFSLLATLANLSILFWGWRWLLPKTSYYWAAVISACYGLSPVIVDQTRQVMSEPVFMTFCLVTITLGQVLLSRRVGQLWSTAMAVSLVLMAYTRSIGLVVGAVLVVWLIWRGGRSVWPAVGWTLLKAAGLLALIVIATPVRPLDLLPLAYLEDSNAQILHLMTPPVNGPVTSIAATAPGEEEITSSQPGVLTSLANKLSYGVRQHLGADLRGLLLPFGGGEREQAWFAGLSLPFVPGLIGYLVSTVALLGLGWLAYRQHFPVFLVFALVYFPLLFLWNWIGPRLLYPIQPQLYLGLFAGLDLLALGATRLARPLRQSVRPVQAGLVAGVLAVLLLGDVARSAGLPNSRQFVGDLARRTSWTTGIAQPDDLLMSEYPETDHLYSRLQTIPYPAMEYSPSDHDLLGYLTDQQVAFILVAPKLVWESVGQPYLSTRAGALENQLESLAQGGQVRLVYDSPIEQIRVYQVVAGGQP